MAGPGTLYQTGSHASRPANGAGCVLYTCTDHNKVYRDNGSAWSDFLDVATTSGVAAHLADATDAHDASAISFDPSGLSNTAATELQTAMEDFDAAIDSAGGGGGLIGVTRYRPGSDSTIYTMTTTPALVDATNLTVTFTAPASGNVLVRFTGTVNMSGTAGTEQYWALWEGGALVGSNTSKVAGSGNFFQVSTAFYLTGISGGSHTYQWAGWKISANAALLSGGPTYGAAVMEVWAA